ncbi:lycopene cyclase domain-containing protein [Cellulomonas sp. P24]|uniref:lycopene cyclase domain-containing protein n=1 Tax=Cellulomonas sp. P24 TaxID=2885206 RepID=UPI00216B3E15|nr:lycopene cyclase domain-containing protein [Cellulomonas sp. P24]MCR6492869.1 lycopene cyclase domain-containing protein [Cellulomonas sp. P24]
MTYLYLDAIVLTLAAVVGIVAARRGRTDRRWWATTALTAGALVVLTVVFDTWMIAADLFRYDESALTGLRIGLTPVEDLAWPIVAAVLLPASWELLGPAPKQAERRPLADVETPTSRSPEVTP